MTLSSSGKIADGSFTAPPGIDATLTLSGGTYSLGGQDGTKETFSSGGILQSEVDRNGNTISYSYNADNTLASIRDTQGRVTTFSYASGRLTSTLT